jgi:hypothetical protein
MMEGGANERIASVARDILQFNDTGVVKDVDYTYTVQAYNSAGSSQPSQPLTVKVKTEVEETDGSDDDDDNYGTRNAFLLGGAIAVILIAGAVVFYLKMTRNIDNEDLRTESPDDLRPEDESTEDDEDLMTGSV